MWWCGLDSSGLGLVPGFCEFCNWSSGSIKAWKFLYQLSYYVVSENNSTQSSYCPPYMTWIVTKFQADILNYTKCPFRRMQSYDRGTPYLVVKKWFTSTVIYTHNVSGLKNNSTSWSSDQHSCFVFGRFRVQISVWRQAILPEIF
jgi:hypothetical protein